VATALGIFPGQAAVADTPVQVGVND